MDVPERFLRLIWQRGLYDAAGLRTADGRPIEILAPGTPNDDAGPDFLGARIRLGGVTYRGDVELHRSAAGWRAHGHQHDPHYNSVILHVVLSAEGVPAVTASRRPLPLLVLHPLLDPVSGAALLANGNEQEGASPSPLPCRTLNDDISAAQLRRWIEHLAAARTELKVRRFGERLRELAEEAPAGVREPFPRYDGNPDDIPKPHRAFTRRQVSSRLLWEQLLYEGIAGALGYAKNSAPFSQLARSVPLAALRRCGLADTTATTAMLFGAAGLLPPVRSVTDAESRAYLRLLRKTWKELRPAVRGPLLHEGNWKFFRLRPANFPTARLAALSRLLPQLFGNEGFRAMVQVFKADGSPRERRRRLEAMFTCTAEGYWSRRYRFGPAARGVVPGPGGGRINDIIVNVVIPVILLYARVFSDGTVGSHARSLLAVLPPEQENRVTRRMEADLLKRKLPLRTAYLQQGILYLHGIYCSTGGCPECEIGKRVFMGTGG